MIVAVASVFTPAAETDDAKPRIGMFRPSTGVWYRRDQSDAGGMTVMTWGYSTDILTPGDYDGDGVEDNAIWRPETGMWYIHRSSDDHLMQIHWGITTQYPTGSLPDVPVPGDYDGDNITDIAVWRPDNGMWYVLLSSHHFAYDKAEIMWWGQLGDIPVPADYDGDGKTDAAVFRSGQNRWYIMSSKDGSLSSYLFGSAGDDILVPGDYTGDGRADAAVYRSGTWFVRDSTTGEVEPFQFGKPNATPIPADYDGDGIIDMAFYNRGIWYINDSSDGGFRTLLFGGKEDVPLASLKGKPSLVGVP
ncbi:MAG: VCBS repeat-containing protein [Blastocatellia bacterium]|nr:VCBS repeat-containing protein [Blastocatellia bacterium]